MREAKKKMIIPSSFEVQIQNEFNENLNFGNILCHLNIYINESSFYTYSFIPTNSMGKVVLTNQQIIQNTELKHYYDSSLILDDEPTRFNFCVIDKNLISNFISSLKIYLNIKPEEIRKDLSRRGFTEFQIIQEIPKAIKKQKEDKSLYDFLILNKNKQLDFSENNSKIEGLWKDESDSKYILNLRL